MQTTKATVRRPSARVLGAALIGLVGSGLPFLCANGALAHEPATAEEVSFATPRAEVSGTLLRPSAPAKVPCVVLIGGTLSQTRDGGLTDRKAPPRDALKRWAEALADAGYASLRFARVGFGKSRPRTGWMGTYHEEAEAAAAAIRYARSRGDLSTVLAAGESAGAYMLCLAAKDGIQADGYIFLGGFCGPAEEMYEYNFGRLAKYAGGSREKMEWAMKQARRDLGLGRQYRAMFAAARAGQSEFELVDGDFRAKYPLARRQEELKFPPDELFREIRAPALALAGAKDLNVPPEHAARAVQIMHAAGNTNAVSFLIPGADHSFRQAPADSDVAFRERYTFESFKRPYAKGAFQTALAWLNRVAPARSGAANVSSHFPVTQRAVPGPERDPKTEHTPERFQFAPGIEIIEDITDKTRTAGIDTLEGRIGLLLLGEDAQAHFIDMPAGLYLAEHPHSTESLIYTVRGRWVLCSQGRRHLMQPGALYRFGSNISTGYEVPFSEDAYILIFKGRRTTEAEKDFVNYLKGMAERLQREHQAGTPFLLKELPKGHPARRFAREVNSEFEK
jgi:pimeloyl-ACP methyl ester carboxylesterase